MKLLASVLTIAAADYACCPYDQYGVPHSVCSDVLTEKSPFAANDVNLVAAESHACKAWEANAGAALENHKADPDNLVHDWGSCGYQRHFPWFHDSPNVAGTANVNALGLFSGITANYQVLGVGGSAGTGFSMHSLTSGSFSGATPGSKQIVGEVHLGGVCKLFVPVQMEFIRQVSIAGVHINNARIAGGAVHANSAEMNAVVMGDLADGVAGSPATGKFHGGTAYCFSVVNIAEFMTNRANMIANANVAGTDTRTDVNKLWNGDDQGLQYDQANVNPGAVNPANFGTIWPGFDGTTTPTAGVSGQKNTGQHKVNMGSNFDVVVHFDSAWCSAHWQLVDMQKVNDHGNGAAATGNLLGANSGTGAQEDMMDAWDKRLPADTGACGLCKDHASATRNPTMHPATVSAECATNTFTAGANGPHTLSPTDTVNYNAAVGTCAPIPGLYMPPTTHRWPNAGAWAAFYSFVTCARSDYMIYGVATRTQRRVEIATMTESLTTTPADAESAKPSTAANTVGNRNNDNRMIVVGGWHQDYRHGTGACVRFNLRQVGEYVHYCSDGDEEEFNAKNAGTLYKNPTGDTQAWSQNHPMRCTWNWNYNALTTNFDAEAWFDSVDPLHMQVWAAGATETVEFVDVPAPGTSNSAGFRNAVKAQTLTSDVTINLLIQERRYKRNGVDAPAYEGPNSLDMDAGYASSSALASFQAGNAPSTSDWKAFDTTGGGTVATVTLACKTGRYNGVGASADQHARMRDEFPDCFFGDEIHGQWTWDTANLLQDLDAASNTAVWKFWAMLTSTP